MMASEHDTHGVIETVHKLISHQATAGIMPEFSSLVGTVNSLLGQLSTASVILRACRSAIEKQKA